METKDFAQMVHDILGEYRVLEDTPMESIGKLETDGEAGTVGFEVETSRQAAEIFRVDIRKMR